MPEMSFENTKKLQKLEVNFMKISTDIEYIKEKVDNLDDFKEEMRKMIEEKADKKDLDYWRNWGISIAVTVGTILVGVISELAYIILNFK